MPNKVTVESPWLRPWINETPQDQDDPNQCKTKQWACMTYEERQAYLKERANTVLTVYKTE